MDALVIRPIDITKRIEVAKLYKAIRMAEDASRVPHTRKERILRKLREDVDRAYMFQRGPRIIGAARISSDPSYRYIKDFAIFKPHQGKGNGTAAFSKLLEVVPGEGPVELDVGIDNERAQKLYENAGFEKVHQWKSTGNWHRI
jgi:RimJ/RimL family protein N-acetyltransferase